VSSCPGHCHFYYAIGHEHSPPFKEDHPLGLIIEFMSKDHDRLDGIFSAFQKTKAENQREAKTLFSQFESGLRRHIVWEEEILFPAFEEQTGMKNMGPTAVMRMEHIKIKELLDQIGQKLQENNIQTEDSEESLIGVLTSHNDKEEKILYPWIDRSLGEEMLTEMIVKMDKSS
jgi:regulator of cell morphogenesis and NO signaling